MYLRNASFHVSQTRISAAILMVHTLKKKCALLDTSKFKTHSHNTHKNLNKLYNHLDI